jgi:hypothetical protein
MGKSNTKDYIITIEEAEWIEYIVHKPTGKLIAGGESVYFEPPCTMTLSLEPEEYEKLRKEKELFICDCGFGDNPHHPEDITLSFSDFEIDDYSTDPHDWDSFDDDDIQSAYIEWFNDGAWGGDFEQRDDKDWLVTKFKWESS